MDLKTMAWRCGFFFLAFWGLILALSLPAWPVSWLALTQAAAYHRFNFRSALAISILLGSIYAGFSSAPMFLWVLPGVLAMSLFHYGKRHFTFHPFVEKMALLVLLWAADVVLMELGGHWLWASGFFSWNSLRILFGTLLTGLIVLPLIQWVFLEIWRRLPKPRSKVREVDWLGTRTKTPWHQGQARKPFGFERNL